MSSLSIQKGKRAEREIASKLNAILEAELGVGAAALKRNLAQSQAGGFDLTGLDWIAIEIKHHKTVAINSWWQQTLRQAVNGREPVLIWKKHGGKWNVRMKGCLPISGEELLPCVVDIDWETFELWFARRARFELQKDKAPSSSVSSGQPPGLFG